MHPYGTIGMHATHKLLAVIGSRLHPKFRVVPQGDVAGWNAKVKALSKEMGNLDERIVENAMLMCFPIRDSGAVDCWGRSPCMFLSGAGPATGSGAANCRLPEGETKMERGQAYAVLGAHEVLPECA